MMNGIAMSIGNCIEKMAFVMDLFSLKILDKKRPHAVIHFIEKLRVATKQVGKLL